MDALAGGIRQLFWHSGERRLRAPLRVGVTLLAVALSLAVLGAVASLAGATGPLAAALGETALIAVTIGLVVGIVRLVDRRSVRDIGLRPTRAWLLDLCAGLLLGAVMAGATVLVALGSGLATVEGTLLTREGDLLAGLSLPAGLLVGVALLFLLAALEEIVFRGYLLVNVAEGVRGLADDRTAVRAGVAVTAVLFGIVHGLNPGASPLSVLNVTLFGLLLGASYGLTDRLALPIGIHAAWNLALGPAFGLPVSGLVTGPALIAVEADGPAVLTGGSFGPEGGLLALVGVAAGTAGLVLWLRRSAGSLTVVERIAHPDLLARGRGGR